MVLFLLSHFVGDVQQLLHVGTVYLDARGAPGQPGQPSTRGPRRAAETSSWRTAGRTCTWTGGAIPSRLGENAITAMLAKARVYVKCRTTLMECAANVMPVIREAQRGTCTHVPAYPPPLH